MPKLTIARHSSGEIIDIKNAKNGLGCDCTCLCCNDRVIARQGEINKGWSFAHESGSECAGALETALHMAAKDIIEKELAVYIGKYYVLGENIENSLQHHMERFYDIFKKANPKSKISKVEFFSSKEIEEKLELAQQRCELQQLKLTDAVKERKAEGSNRIPDITANYRNNKLYIEIVVTNECDKEKINELKLLGVPTLQIDISALRKTEFCLNDISEAIVNPLYKELFGIQRKWIVKPQYIREADMVAQEFKVAALKKLDELKEATEERKQEIARRTSDVYFLNRRFRIDQRESWANVWIPKDRMDNKTIKAIASVLKELRAEGNNENWTIKGSNVRKRLEIEFNRLANEEKNRALALKQREEKMTASFERLELRKKSEEFNSYGIDEESKHLEQQVELSQKAEEERVNAEQAAISKLKSEKLRDEIIDRHSAIKDHRYRLKMINDDLIANGEKPL